MPANKIVVHDKGGSVLKGTTADFLPKRPLFHIAVGVGVCTARKQRRSLWTISKRSSL